MLTCLATYEERMATLLETAAQFTFYDLGAGGPSFMGFSPRPDGGPASLAALLTGCGAELLVCGAIDRAYAEVLKSRGIEVVAWVCGSVPAVVQALWRGDLTGLAMPGAHPLSNRRLRRIVGRSSGHPAHQAPGRADAAFCLIHA